jgi:hypothetical protein
VDVWRIRWSVALEKTKTELVRWVILVLLGNAALSLAANALLNASNIRVNLVVGRKKRDRFAAVSRKWTEIASIILNLTLT